VTKSIPLFITDSTFASSACFSYRGEWTLTSHLLPLTSKRWVCETYETWVCACAYAREKFWCSYQTIRVSY